MKTRPFHCQLAIFFFWATALTTSIQVDAQTNAVCRTYVLSGATKTLQGTRTFVLKADGTQDKQSQETYENGDSTQVATRNTQWYDAKKKCQVFLLEKLETSERIRDEWYSTTLPNGKMVNHLHKKLIDGELAVDDTFKYDSQYRLIERLTYNYQGETNTWKNQYKYNKKGQLFKEVGTSHWYGVSVKGDEIQFTKKLVKISKYDKAGKLVKVRLRKAQKGKEIYVYNEQGKLTAKHRTWRWVDDSQGKKAVVRHKEEQHQTFTDTGSLVEETQIKDGKTVYHRVCKYNEQGKISQDEQKDGNGNTILTQKYEYDSLGRLVRRDERANNADTLRMEICEYH